MDKRRVFKICISVFLFFVAMAVLEIAIRGISKGISNIASNVKEEKKQDEIYNSETNKSWKEEFDSYYFFRKRVTKLKYSKKLVVTSRSALIG